MIKPFEDCSACGGFSIKQQNNHDDNDEERNKAVYTATEGPAGGLGGCFGSLGVDKFRA